MSQKSTTALGAASKATTVYGSASAAQQQQQHHSYSSQNDGKINLEDYAYNKIFVGGLHYDTRDGKLFFGLLVKYMSLPVDALSSFLRLSLAEFRLYFEKYGKVISAEVMFNRETHKSRGFGFIVFEVENSAVKVCTVKEHSIDGKVVSLYFFHIPVCFFIHLLIPHYYPSFRWR